MHTPGTADRDTFETEVGSPLSAEDTGLCFGAVIESEVQVQTDVMPVNFSASHFLKTLNERTVGSI